MFGDITDDVKAHVEKIVMTKIDELNERISMVLSARLRETNIKAEFDALNVQIAGIETQFREGHAALIKAINAHTTSPNSQTRLLEALCNQVKSLNEKVDKLSSHASCLENIAVVGCTPKGDVFGGFYSVAVTKQDSEFFDPNIFAFSFESHGRCETPLRFGVRKSGKRRQRWGSSINGLSGLSASLGESCSFHTWK